MEFSQARKSPTEPELRSKNLLVPALRLVSLSRQNEQQIAQAIEISQNDICRRWLSKSCNSALRASGDRPRHVQSAALFPVTRDNEFPQLGQRRTHAINLAFESCNLSVDELKVQGPLFRADNGADYIKCTPNRLEEFVCGWIGDAGQSNASRQFV